MRRKMYLLIIFLFLALGAGCGSSQPGGAAGLSQADKDGAVEVVTKHLEGRKNDFGVISLSINSVGAVENAQHLQNILEDEDAAKMGLSKENIALVDASINVQYDGTKVPNQSGDNVSIGFTLIRRDKDSPWLINNYGQGLGGVNLMDFANPYPERSAELYVWKNKAPTGNNPYFAVLSDYTNEINPNRTEEEIYAAEASDSIDYINLKLNGIPNLTSLVIFQMDAADFTKGEMAAIEDQIILNTDNHSISIGLWEGVKYKYQEAFHTHQIVNRETEITPELIMFFHDYFSKNGNELRLLPEFEFGQAPSWDDLSHYIIFNAGEDFVDGSISEENFNRQVTRFFWPVIYTQKTGKELIYKDGKYTVRYGSDAHGWAVYELTGLNNKGKTERGPDKWEATIRGYFFHEMDSDPAGEGHSKNGKAVWAEMEKEENKGLTFRQVQDSLILKNPGSVLELGCEWTIEFAVNDPEGELYFTYMSCSKKPREEQAASQQAAAQRAPSDIYLYQQYPSGYEFIKTVSGLRGEAEITNELREKFNRFAQDYRWCYLPDMDGYESFFDTGHSYANALGYTNFADAVFYAMSYLRFPEKVSEQTVQSTIEALFVAKDGVPQPMPHQAYRKIANYADGYYSPWPESTPAYDRMFFLLTGLQAEEQASGEVYITVRAKQYYFEHPSYEPGENEIWLAEKAKELGLADLEAAARLIAENKMDGIEGSKEYETTLVYLMKNAVPVDYAPRVVFSRSRSLE